MKMRLILNITKIIPYRRKSFSRPNIDFGCMTVISENESKELAKRLSGDYTVEKFLPVTNQKDAKRVLKIGIGSGTTIVHFVKKLAEFVKSGMLDNCVCVPTSFQAKLLIIENGLVLGDLQCYPELDIAVDGIDEIDPEFNAIKGGGGCLLQEKVVASAAKKFIVLADESKKSERLCSKWKKGIPLEVLPMAYAVVSARLKALGLAPNLRMAVSKIGPVVTDNGNFLIDAVPINASLKVDKALDQQLHDIPGVLETGLFFGMIDHVVIGNYDGTISELDKRGAVV